MIKSVCYIVKRSFICGIDARCDYFYTATQDFSTITSDLLQGDRNDSDMSITISITVLLIEIPVMSNKIRTASRTWENSEEFFFFYINYVIDIIMSRVACVNDKM